MVIPVLQTKFFVPKPQLDLVHRYRLIRQLDEGSRRKLTLLSAPAGSGKTALMSAWVASTNPKIGWLSLDASDNDSTRFWAYFIGALQRVQDNLGQKAQSFLQTQGPGLRPFPVELCLTILINEIAAY